MGIEEHFTEEAIASNGVFLDEDEEQNLAEYLEGLIDKQLQTAPHNGEEGKVYTPEMALSLAGLAFVAGRSYQQEMNEEEPVWEPTVHDNGMVPVYLEPDAAGRLIKRLLEG